MLAACLGLAGCLAGPNYKAPPLPRGSSAALVSPGSPAGTDQPPADDWWRLYRDPTLDRLIAEALEANTDLKAADAHLSMASAVLTLARAGRYPSTTLQAQATRGRDPVTDEILEIDRAKPTTIWKFGDALDVAYELDLSGRVRRTIEAAKADAQAVAAIRDDLKVTVAAETTRAYAEVCVSGEQLRVAQQSVEVVSREAQIVARRQAAGEGSRFDVVRAEALVADARASLPPIQGRRRAALLDLTALLGRTPANAPVEVLACVEPPGLAQPIPVGDGAALLKRRPDVRRADRQLAAATARIGVAVADLYPHISLVGSYGGAASTTAILTRNAGLAWGIGPQITWAFPNQSAQRARIRQSKAAAEAALDEFDSAVLTALKETERALAIYGAELDHQAALGQAQAKAAEAFALARGQFAAGSISVLDLLTTEQAMIATDAALASSDAAVAEDQVSLFKALGGGWRTGGASPDTGLRQMTPLTCTDGPGNDPGKELS